MSKKNQVKEMAKVEKDGTSKILFVIAASCTLMMLFLILLINPTFDVRAESVMPASTPAVTTPDVDKPDLPPVVIYPEYTGVWSDCDEVPVWLQLYIVDVTENFIKQRPDLEFASMDDVYEVKLTPSLIMALLELNTNFGKDTDRPDEYNKYYFSGITGGWERNYKHGLFGVTDAEIEAYEYIYNTTVTDKGDVGLGTQLTVIHWWINYGKLALKYGRHNVDQCIEKWESRFR